MLNDFQMQPSRYVGLELWLRVDAESLAMPRRGCSVTGEGVRYFRALEGVLDLLWLLLQAFKGIFCPQRCVSSISCYNSLTAK